MCGSPFLFFFSLRLPNGLLFLFLRFRHACPGNFLALPVSPSLSLSLSLSLLFFFVFARLSSSAIAVASNPFCLFSFPGVFLIAVLVGAWLLLRLFFLLPGLLPIDASLFGCPGRGWVAPFVPLSNWSFRVGRLCGSPLFVGVLPGYRLPSFRRFLRCLPQRLVFSPLCSLALFVFPSLSLALFFLFSCLYSRWLPERRALAFAATWVNRVGASHFEDNCFKLGRMASRPLRGGFFVVRFAPFLASRRLPPVAAPVFCFVSDGFRPPLLGLRVFLWCMDFSRRSIPISCFFCLFSISRDFLTLPLAPCC